MRCVWSLMSTESRLEQANDETKILCAPTWLSKRFDARAFNLPYIDLQP